MAAMVFQFAAPANFRFQKPQKLGTALFGGAGGGKLNKLRNTSGGKLDTVRKMSGTKPEEAPAPSYPELKPGSVWIVIKSHKLQLNPGKKDGGVSRKDAIRGKEEVAGAKTWGVSRPWERVVMFPAKKIKQHILVSTVRPPIVPMSKYTQPPGLRSSKTR